VKNPIDWAALLRKKILFAWESWQRDGDGEIAVEKSICGLRWDTGGFTSLV
jgi:hypothetical protein